MTCAACANRIQGRLAQLDGVSDATVNFATGRATVRHDSKVTDDDFRVAIESLGYGVIESERGDEAEARREANLWRRFLVAVTLAAPAMIISMIAPLRFPGWEWVVAALATPVIFWSSPWYGNTSLV